MDLAGKGCRVSGCVWKFPCFPVAFSKTLKTGPVKVPVLCRRGILLLNSFQFWLLQLRKQRFTCLRGRRQIGLIFSVTFATFAPRRDSTYTFIYTSSRYVAVSRNCASAIKRDLILIFRSACFETSCNIPRYRFSIEKFPRDSLVLANHKQDQFFQHRSTLTSNACN